MKAVEAHAEENTNRAFKCRAEKRLCLIRCTRRMIRLQNGMQQRKRLPQLSPASLAAAAAVAAADSLSLAHAMPRARQLRLCPLPQSACEQVVLQYQAAWQALHGDVEAAVP